jgi:hypothetical protein
MDLIKFQKGVFQEKNPMARYRIIKTGLWIASIS